MTETRTPFQQVLFDYLKEIPEEGPITREEVAVWARWSQTLVNDLETAGYVYRGMSVKYQGWSTLLVVKVASGLTPLVVFVTEKDTTGCMRSFLRMFDEERVQWRDDKFA